MNLRPLDKIRSIKVKLGIVIIASMVASVIVVVYGWWTDIKPRFLIVFTSLVALAVIQFLAHGMTKPLRQMAAAAPRMARGDYSVRVTATSRDEVGELARAFNSMAADLAEVDEHRRALIANVSHELRTPLAGVQARLENMVDGIEPADTATLERALRSVQRLSRLVDQLLDLSRLEGGDVPMRRQAVPARELVEAVVDEAELADPAARFDVRIDADPVVHGDPDRIHQVLANLVENAVRHSPAGAVVTIAASASDAGVRLDVSDCGPGIPPDVGQRVFERFSQFGGNDRRGAGLGLAIARWIVDLHGGSIWAEPAMPTGCRMVVEIPDKEAQS